jgi:broad specificity phosphatase PhoE
MHLPSLVPSLLALAGTCTSTPHASHTTYSVVPSIFLQDLNTTSPTGFDFIATNFGLINRTYPSDSSCAPKSTQWQRLAHYISTLNHQAPRNEHYTLLFLGRHGEGFHNAAETYFGTPAWNCFWSERDGNGTVTWADAQLTPAGVTQALRVNAFWARLLRDEKIPAPQRYYSSPLARCVDTARLTFSNLTLPIPFKPVIKELLREGISAHTCDRRSSKTAIQAQFPGFAFERGFAEQDPFWTELRAEPAQNQDARSKVVLDEIVDGRATYVSVSSHSGEIASLLRGKKGAAYIHSTPLCYLPVSLFTSFPSPLPHFLRYVRRSDRASRANNTSVLGHRPFSLSTGSAIPVLVKSTRVRGAREPSPTTAWAVQKTCAAAPTIREPSCNDCSCCV